jgi:hypothetical protein
MGKFYSHNVQGKGIINAQNIEEGYLVFNVKDGRNAIACEGGEQGDTALYDCIDIGHNSHHNYGVLQWGQSEHCYCCIFGGGKSFNCYYSMNLDTCSYCL